MTEIPLTQGYVAFVDDEDAEAVLAHKWHARRCPSGKVYAGRSFRRADGVKTAQYLHTFLTGYALTDHRNDDGLDNRRANLREATRSQNAMNRPAPSTNTSGYKGVRRSRDRWMANIGTPNGQAYLGTYDTPEGAAAAYDEAALLLHGEYARLNLVKGRAQMIAPAIQKQQAPVGDPTSPDYYTQETLA